MGKKTLLVNAGLPIGGTSINIGAIPTKHLVRVAASIRKASHSFFNGVTNIVPKLDAGKILNEKRRLVKSKRENDFLLPLTKMKNVTLLKGWASFKNKKNIIVDGKEYNSKYFLIATGSVTKAPFINGLKSCEYLTLTTACDFDTPPKSVTIIGGGNLGLELSMVYTQLGIKVRIIEKSNQIFKRQMPDIAEEIEKSLKLENIEILKNYHINKIVQKGPNTIIFGTHEGKQSKIIESGKIILTSGIKGNTKKLNLENAGIKTGYKDLILVTNKMETSSPNIYSAGDCAKTPCFACVADLEARTAVLNMFVRKTIVDYSYFPWVAFTYPQVAGAGMNEREAEKEGISYEVSKVPIKKIPKAQISNENIGFVKLIRNTKTDILIGGQVIGSEAGELAGLISFLIKKQVKISEIAEGLFPYLTLSECIRNAAIAFNQNEKQLVCSVP